MAGPEKSKSVDLETQFSSDSLGEEEIDSLKLPRAFELCKLLKIDISSKPKLREMRWMIKKATLCQETRKEEILRTVDDDAENDKEQRECLIELYEETESYLDAILKLDDPVVEELQRMGHGTTDLLQKERKKLQNAKSPILVLGETGSGKSFFINVLLGENYLPCSMLSNTHVVTEIMYGESPKVFLYGKVGSEVKLKTTIENLPKDEFKTQLADHVQKVDGGKAVYTRAEVYLPSPVLKCGLVIVDSPGVGENDEMKEMVLDYLINACAFIYIIDSNSAGGLQDRMQQLLHAVYEKALQDQKDYRPDSAIFVLNKWDMVPIGEREEVWKNAQKKITEKWPDSKLSQIFQFSALEAEFIAKDGGGLSPRWEKVLSEINKLLPIGREMLVLKQYRFLEAFCHRCLVCLGAHLNQIGKSSKERESRRKLVKDRLTCLQKNMDSFFVKETQQLEDDIQKLANDLRVFLKTEEIKHNICQFSKQDLPTSSDWKHTSIEVRSVVYGRLMDKIRHWEISENKFKKIGERLTERLAKEFPKFNAEIEATQEELSKARSNVQGTELSDVEDEETDFLPEAITNKFKGLSFGMKLALGLGLSPVILVTLAVRAPYIGLTAFKKALRDYGRADLYANVKSESEKLELCKDYAEQTLDTITDKLKLITIIKEDLQPLFLFLKQQQQLMKETVESDLKLLATLQQEHRSDQDIERIYSPLQAKFEILNHCLRCFLITRFPEKHCPFFKSIQLIDIQKIDPGVWTAATMYTATSVIPSSTMGHKQVHIRRAAAIMKSTNFSIARSILEAYSQSRHNSLITCYGTTKHDKDFYQVFEPLQCSVRLHFSEELRNNKENMCLHIIKEVVAGLVYLHDRNFVHFDLSLDTVYVDKQGRVKLTNINLCNRDTTVMPIVTQEGHVHPGKYIHLHPKFFTDKRVYTDSKGKRRLIQYDQNDDMYSLGIMMWELFKGSRLVSITDTFQLEQKPEEVSALPRRSTLLNMKKEHDEQVVNAQPLQKFQEHLMELVAQEKLMLFCEDFSGPYEGFWILWRKSITDCLDGMLTAHTFEEKWNDYTPFPRLTVVHGSDNL